MQSFIIVFGQVLSLFIMMAVGFGMFKIKMIDEKGAAQMTDLLLYAVTPCIVINAFDREFSANTAKAIGVFAVTGFAAMLFSVIVAALVFRCEDKNTRAVQRFALVFSNCGFMGIPLAEAICGAEGVLYSSIFCVIFNLFQWTYGVVIISGEKLSIKKIFLNPAMVGLIVGLPVFLFSLNLPSPIESAVGMLANLNSPLAMVVIGTHLAKADLVSTFKDVRCYTVTLWRLVLLPAILMAPISMLPFLDKTQIITLAVQCGAPVAAGTALFATKYNREPQLAGKMVAISTVLSMITLPLLVALLR